MLRREGKRDLPNGNNRKNTNFLITEEHIRRGKQDNPGGNPLALALRENELITNPAAHPISTLEKDNQGRKLGNNILASVRGGSLSYWVLWHLQNRNIRTTLWT